MAERRKIDLGLTGYDELLPFCMVPVFSFGDSRFAYVDADLSAVECMNQLCE